MNSASPDYRSCRRTVQIIVFLLYTGLHSLSFAQDSHYWTLQYGTRSTLLGGAVIGSVSDLGAVYYNPGMLSLLGQPTFILSARIFQRVNFRVENALPGERDLSSTSLKPAPSLTAGSFTIKGWDRHKFGYSFLVRSRTDLGVSLRDSTIVELAPETPARELVFGSVRLSQNVRDDWYGFSWSYQLKDDVGIGLTPFLSIRDQRTIFRTNVLGLRESNDVATLGLLNEYDYEVWRALMKIGIGIRRERFTAGLTITTPSALLWGDGDSAVNLSLSNARDGNDFLATDFQEDVAADYKS
jgi:hypothetical protein